MFLQTHKSKSSTVGCDPIWRWKSFFFFFLLFRGAPEACQGSQVPRLGVESELQLQAYATTTQCGIQAAQATSVSYTIAHGKARSPTHQARPGTEPASSWILAGFVSAAPRQELPSPFFLKGEAQPRRRAFCKITHKPGQAGA